MGCNHIHLNNLLLYHNLSGRQDSRVSFKDQLLKTLRGSSRRSYVDGHNVYGMVRTCDFPDIDAHRDGCIICENKKNTCDGSNFAACDILFLLKNRTLF